MLEVAGLIFYLVLFGLCAALDPALLTPLEQQLWLNQSVWALIITITLYALIMIVGGLILQWQVPELYQQFFGESTSLAGLAQVLVAVLLVIGGSYIALVDHQANPLFVGTLLGGGITLLCNTIWRWRARNRAPAPPTHIQITKHAGMIRVSWQPPNDPRYAESRVVRTLWGEPPPHHAWITGRAAYQGVLNDFEDRTAQPDQRYRYTIFSLDARERAGMGLSHPDAGYTLPIPEPPKGLDFESSTNHILLSWYLLDIHTIRKVEICRQLVGSDDPPLIREVDAEPPPDSSMCEYKDVLLPSGQTFEYTLVAIDHDQQRSSPTSIRAATRVASPAFKVKAEGRNYAHLVWKIPDSANEPERVIISRRLANEPENHAVTIYEGNDKEHIDKGSDDQGLEYDTNYCYTIEAIYANQVKSERVEHSMTTGTRVSSIRQEHVNIQSTRRTIRLMWHLPSNERITAVHIVRSWHDLITDQERHREWNEQAISEFTDRDVEPAILYTYAISVSSQDEHSSLPVKVTAELQPAPAGVNDLTAHAEHSNGSIQLSWRMPLDPSIQGVLIVRSTNRLVLNPSDGEFLYKGAGETYIDTSAGGSEYTYAIFTYDSEEVYSDPVFVRHQQPLSITISLPTLPEADTTISPPRDLTIRKLVSGILKKAKVKREEVSDWQAVIVETGQQLQAEQTLEATGIEHGQTIAISFELLPAEDEPPTVADVETPVNAQPMDEPAPSNETSEPPQ